MPILAAACLTALPLISISAAAQYVGQVTDKSATHFRAVAVLEWTGDLAHPKASRLVPITVFDGQQLQDGSIYLAHPQPLALDGEVEYELQNDGKTIGFYDIHSAAEQQGYWIGFGNWKALPAGPTPAELARQRQMMAKVDADDENSDQPVLHRKHHADDADSGSAGSGNGSQAPAADPDRPTLHKAGDAGSSSGNSGSNSGSSSSSNGPTLHRSGDAGGNAGADPSGGNNSSGSSAPAQDPDRPTLHRSTDDSASNDGSTNGTGSGATDPDRPRLQKKQGQNEASQDRPGNDEASVSSLPDVSDPDRPRLKRGKPAGSGADVAPTLMGMPSEMEQQVAVSDAKPVKDHPWDYSWANADDETKMKSSMEDIARKELGLDQSATASKSTRTAAKRTSVHKKAAPPPPPAPLLDEKFRVFELAYGTGATMVLSAHTDGTGAQQKFVTLVAQPDLYGSVVVLTKNVTDGAHLDVKPQMVLIDAVDAEADNRGELLFELRGQSQRQFSLYRVYRGQMTQLFTSTPEYWGSTQGE
jgi:hypothetical protein